MAEADGTPAWSRRILSMLPGALALLSLAACAFGWLFSKAFDTPLHQIVMLVAFPVLLVLAIFAALIRMALRQDPVCRKLASWGLLLVTLAIVLFGALLARGLSAYTKKRASGPTPAGQSPPLGF